MYNEFFCNKTDVRPTCGIGKPSVWQKSSSGSPSLCGEGEKLEMVAVGASDTETSVWGQCGNIGVERFLCTKTQD